eukprot:7376343-Prymnesium_polylepis.1
MERHGHGRADLQAPVHPWHLEGEAPFRSFGKGRRHHWFACTAAFDVSRLIARHGDDMFQAPLTERRPVTCTTTDNDWLVGLHETLER